MHAFWEWFESVAAEVHESAGDDREEWINRIFERLQEIDGGLYLEVARPKDGVSELVVTAEGNRELFGLVDELISSAPRLETWRFTALRPPMGCQFGINYEGVKIDPRKMWYLHLKSDEDPDLRGLRLGIPGLDPDQMTRADAAARIMLDTVLGERAVATSVDHVEVVPLPNDFEAAGFRPVIGLAQDLADRGGRRA